MAANGVQIISDGTSEGTKVLLDGRPVRGVIGVTWQMAPASRKATLVLELSDVRIDAAAEVPVEVRESLANLTETLP